MSRVLLVLAMVLSLWPAAALALSFTSDASDTGSGTKSSAVSDSPSPQVFDSQDYDPEVDDPEVAASKAADAAARYNAAKNAIKALDARSSRVLARFDKSGSLRGEPDPRLSKSAGALARDLQHWLDTYGVAARPRDDFAAVATANRAVIVRVRDFAKTPTAERLTKFNTAVDAYNKAIKTP